MSTPSNSNDDRGNARLRPFWITLLVLFGVSALEWCLWWSKARGVVSPMAAPDVRYSDWTNFLGRSANLFAPGMLTRTELGLPFPYPLPAVWIFYPVARFSHHPLGIYLALTVGLYLAVVALFSRCVWKRTHSVREQGLIWGAALLFHPFWFLLDRANIEIFLWAMIAAGLYAFIKHPPSMAAIFFGLAASMKIYPALLFLLFLQRRQFKAFLLGIGTFLVVTLATYQIAGPTIPQAIHAMQSGANLLRESQIAVASSDQMRWDHSLFALLKQADYFLVRRMHAGQEVRLYFGTWIQPYGALAFLCFGAVYLLWMRHLPLLNQPISLMLFSILLPFVSYDYTLIVLALVFGMLLLVSEERSAQVSSLLHGWTGTLFAVSMAVCCSPLTNLAHGYYGGQVKCFFLIAMLVVALCSPLPSRLFGDDTRPVRVR